jgi:hypothetical protein
MVAEQPQILETAKAIKAKANGITLKGVYRKEMKMARAAARVIDHHPTLSNVLLVLMGVGFLVEVILFG